jgi:spore germination cell wall hydrolase CwlJ-like protein
MRIEDLNDEDTMALTLWGEARGEGLDGMAECGQVIMNRARRQGYTIKTVCLQPKQFSCWNKGDANRAQLDGLIEAYGTDGAMTSSLKRAQWIAKGLMRGYLGGVFGTRATHYHSRRMDPYPSWTKDPNKMRKLGLVAGHVFYEEVGYGGRRAGRDTDV